MSLISFYLLVVEESSSGSWRRPRRWNQRSPPRPQVEMEDGRTALHLLPFLLWRPGRVWRTLLRRILPPSGRECHSSASQSVATANFQPWLEKQNSIWKCKCCFPQRHLWAERFPSRAESIALCRSTSMSNLAPPRGWHQANVLLLCAGCADWGGLMVDVNSRLKKESARGQSRSDASWLRSGRTDDFSAAALSTDLIKTVRRWLHLTSSDAALGCRHPL